MSTEHKSSGTPLESYELSRHDHRWQNSLDEIHRPHRWTDDMRLTYAEYTAGAACRGCGRELLTAPSWSGAGKGTMYYTDEERAEADAEERVYQELHGDCRAARWRIQGVTHCMHCCPPPPLSPEQIDRVAQLLLHPTPPESLMRWRVRLYCGHITETTRHVEMRSPTDAGSSCMTCPECGKDPSAIAAYEPLGRVREPDRAPGTTPKFQRSPKQTRAQLEARVAELEAELARVREIDEA